jgi:hypothetical protein
MPGVNERKWNNFTVTILIIALLCAPVDRVLRTVKGE